MTTIAALHWIASWIVLAEALNKLERADLFEGRCVLERMRALVWLTAPWCWRRDRVVTAFKVIGWSLLSIGAGGGVATPFLQRAPSLEDAAVSVGFAFLIVRSRIKEG